MSDNGQSVSLRVAVSRVLIAATAGAGFIAPMSTTAAELPQACAAAALCGGVQVPGWITSGTATRSVTGNTLDINQTSDRAILNWESFNVSADGRVNFNQPSRSSITLNRIYQGSPSRIFGQVTANGEIYLINPNGIIFGRTARIDAAGILASTLDIADSTFDTGIAADSVLRATSRPQLDSKNSQNFAHRLSVLDESGNVVRGHIDADGNLVKDPNGEPITVQLTVQEGAQLATSGSNGRILLAAQEVANAGKLTAADGQVILAAGDSVFLQASSDSALRGLTVEVDAGGKAWNQLSGAISTPRGNTTLVGFAVNQDGRISASTSVSANGSIRLLARDDAQVDTINGSIQVQSQRTGTLEFGAGSETSIVPDSEDTAAAVDDQVQLLSHIEAMGRRVTIRENAVLRATGGRIDVSAIRNPAGAVLDATDLDDGKLTDTTAGTVGGIDRDSQLRVESGAVIDVSGSDDAQLQMSRNLVEVELRGSEFADSPSQRDGALRGKKVIVDARVGTTLADVTGALAAVPKTISERTSQGGQIVFVSEGDIVTSSGSIFDVSGGQLNYQSGIVATSQLIGADGKIYDIGTADPGRTYVGLINPVYRRVDDRWGQIELSGVSGLGQLEPGYVQGKSAGTLQFAAPSLVLNGSFTANTVVGPYQRSAGSTPQGGHLVVGLAGTPVGQSPNLDYRAPSVEFVSTAPAVSVADESPLLPEDASVGPTLKLSTDYLRNGFTQTDIYSNGTVTVPEGVPLDLTAGSSFTASGQTVSVLSDITSAGGAISLLSHDPLQVGPASSRPGIVIGDGVTLDVRGLWTNDSLLDQQVRPVDPLLPNGGSISLSVGGNGIDAQNQPLSALLSIGDNAQFLASGGGTVSRTGTVEGGKGGSIALLTNGQNTDIDIGSNVGLEAFGVQGAAGGSFSFTAPTIEVGNDTVWSAAQEYDSSSPTAFFAIGSALFSDYGFATVKLSAAQVRAEPETDPNDPNAEPATPQTDILRIAPGTSIDARVKNLQLNTDAGTMASAANVTGFSSVVLLDAHLRQGADISFTAGFFASAADGALSDRAGDLSVGVGANLRGDVGSSFAFSSVGDLILDGSIYAPGGTITAGLANPATDRDVGFIEGQRLQVGRTAVLDVSGTVVYTPDDLLQLGSVVDGGSIELASNRGSVLVDSGARLDISGSSAALDVATGDEKNPYVRQTVASSGGSLLVRAPESIGLYGDVDAAAGKGDVGQAEAGSLSLELTRNAGFGASTNVPSAFPQVPRTIEVSDNEVVGHALPANGVALISQAFIARSGIDSLSLRADDEIVLRSDVNLSLGRQLSLDTQKLSISGGGRVDLAAPYVSIGNSLEQSTAATAAAGSSQLNIQADFIEIIGSSVLSSMSQATLYSTGDIRLRGTTRVIGEERPSIGSLNIAGDLSLQAARVYGSTNTQFTVTAAGGKNDRIEIKQTGTSSGTPLSVGSSLRLVAKDIEQGGTLLAPFGSISLEGEDAVHLLDGSLTSVSGSGTLFLYGSVSIGEWDYTNANTATAVAGVPDRQITIDGDDVELAAGAVVDVSGGGDLYAYEWVPGTGGRQDALAAGETPGLYAILPSLRGQVAPYDPQEYANSDLSPGDSVYLSGIDGLEAGVYPLLPARYALLPGAYLVSAVGNTNGIAPGSVAALSDGTRVIAGYTTFGNTQLGNTQYSGFAIRSGSYGRALAQYDDYFASTFFSDRAERLGLGRVTIGADAGSLSLLAGSQLDAQGTVRTKAEAGGRDATIDVSALRLAITNGAGSDDSTVSIDANRIREWNPGTLILGGHRVAGSDDQFVVAADEVSLGEGVNLSADEIIIAAHDEVSIGAGATLSTTGTTPIAADVEAVTLDLSGTADRGAAILAVSDFAPVLVNRGTAAVTQGGTVQLSAGSTLSSHGAITVDAPLGGELSGTLDASGAKLSLGANRLVFGSTPLADAFVLDSGFDLGLQQAGAVRFAAAAIDVQRNVDLDLLRNDSELELDAGVISAAQPGLAARFSAHEITLRGAAIDNNAASPAAGSSQLQLTADTVRLEAGGLDLSGFSQTVLTARQQVIATGESRMRVSGDLDIVTPQIALASDAEASIVNDGTARLLRPDSGGSAPTNTELGGSLQLSANRIEDATAIVAGSGLVSMQATTQLQLLDAAAIDVAGRNVSAGGRTVGSQGGSIRLIAGSDMSTAAGASLLLGGAGDSSAGNLQMQVGGTASLNASMSAPAGTNAIGGSFDLTAGQLTDFAALNAVLQQGGFTHAQNIRVHAGDLNLGAASQITAESVSLVSDTGAISIGGTIQAQGSSTLGTIRIYAGGDVDLLAGAKLNVDATDGGLYGGNIEIGSTHGTVDLAPGSVITAKGAAESGSLTVSASLNDAGDDLRIERLAASLSGIERVDIVPTSSVFAFDVASDLATTTDILAASDGARTAASTFVDTYGAAIRTRLSIDGAEIVLRPQIEFNHTGDLALNLTDEFGNDSPLVLNTWRYGGEAGSLIVRSSGSLSVNGLLTDGFTTIGNNRLELLSTASSAISLIAGADRTSADTRATLYGASADLRIGAGSTGTGAVRTGTGAISLAASRDVFFDPGVSVFTAGLLGSPSLQQPLTQRISFPDRGGAVSVRAGRDVIGSGVQQSVSTWQFRGLRTSATGTPAHLYGIDLEQFGWNLGTLGGGDVSVIAGRNVNDLSAAAADSAVVLADNTILHFGGGSMAIQSGNDVNSSLFFGAQGTMRIRAEGALGSDRVTANNDALGTSLALGNASATIEARKDILLERALNPTVLAMPSSVASSSRQSYFFTYGDNSALRLQSAAGDVYVSQNKDRTTNFEPELNAQEGDAFQIYPSSLLVHAFSGDIVVNSTFRLFPSDTGQLDLFAARDITGGASRQAIQMSDGAAAGVPTIRNGQNASATAIAEVLKNAASARHGNDATPVLITAGRDIADTLFSVPKSARITADRDISDVSIYAQNLRSTDVTLISAGRDVAYTSSALNLNSEIAVGGPGQLEVLAGRDVDLGFTRGISTIGRRDNPSLPTAEGAGITVMAGLGEQPDYAGFIDQIIAPSSDYDAELIAYVAARTGSTLSRDEALAVFSALSVDAQRPFVDTVFFSELVRSGREANTSDVGFSRGFAAVDALFPSSGAASGDASQSKYSGNLNMAFSRIYTLFGGDISLLIPGGHLNVGLANPPPTISSRKPSELGIVAQGAGNVHIFSDGDVLVNSSRVFTLLGGNIAVWSTRGNIDAGRGAKSSLAAPPPTITIDDSGKVEVSFTGAVAGSGIRTIVTDTTVEPGDVDLIAPVGFVNAGDAGIGSAGNLNIAAKTVVGLDNIQVGGTSTGVPAETSGLGASLAGVTAAASSSSKAASDSTEGDGEKNRQAAPQLSQAALSWLDVFVVGLGEDNCKQDDIECLKRQRTD